MSMPATAGVVRFSTDALPVRDRVPYWIDVFSRSIAGLDAEPVPDRPFRQAASLRALDGLGMMLAETNGIRVWRDGRLLSDGCDDLLFLTNLSGVSQTSQLGRTLELRAGAALMLTSAEIATHVSDAARFLILKMPRPALANLVPYPESALMRIVPESSEALRLLVDYVTTLDKHDLSSPQVRQAIATHVHDLVALAIGATQDATELALGRGLRAARLKAIKVDIVSRLSDEGLSVAETAKRHRVTPRYVHMLFEAEGQTFSEYVIEQRLARAYRMLTDPKLVGSAISSIAFEVGFANLSYFNRVFRRRYGAPPSDIRAQRRQQDR
jgi:AraC-like DNA-binding protein